MSGLGRTAALAPGRPVALTDHRDRELDFEQRVAAGRTNPRPRPEREIGKAVTFAGALRREPFWNERFRFGPDIRRSVNHVRADGHERLCGNSITIDAVVGDCRSADTPRRWRSRSASVTTIDVYVRRGRSAKLTGRPPITLSTSSCSFCATDACCESRYQVHVRVSQVNS